MKKKVLMIIEGVIPSIGGGGAENQVITLCTELSKEYDCLIVAPMVSFGIQKEHDTFKNIDIYRIPYPKIKALGKLILLLKLAMYLFNKRNEYHVIHAHIAGSMSAVSSLIGYFLKKLVIVKMTGWTEVDRGILSETHRNNIINIFNRSCIKLSTYVHATSCFISGNLKKFGFQNEKILYLPNAVDTEKFIPKKDKSLYREELEISSLLADDVVGLYVGRLEHEKGIYEFVKQWCEVITDNSFKLLIVGEGSLENNIRSLIEQYDLKNNVFLLGAQTDINKYTLACDFGVLPSMHEGLSNTLLEYMSSSLPVIGTRVSGTEDMIETDSNGWLYDYGDDKALRLIFSKLLSLGAISLALMGKVSREKIVSVASIEIVTSKFKEIYQEA